MGIINKCHYFTDRELLADIDRCGYSSSTGPVNELAQRFEQLLSSSEEEGKFKIENQNLKDKIDDLKQDNFELRNKVSALEIVLDELQQEPKDNSTHE